MPAAENLASEGGFELFDLRVEVQAPEGARLWCGNRVGDFFEVHGELLHFREDMPFSLYTLASVLPLLPAKQRPAAPSDWMTTDAEVACPDPNCPSRLRITRIGTRCFRHAETTAVKLVCVAGGAEQTDQGKPA